MIILNKKTKYKLFYSKNKIDTNLKKNIKILFADDIASGRPSPYIDNKILKKVIPYYSNTHSNAITGQIMANKIENTRNKIRQTYNLDKNYKIIFTGNGCTSAINHLINSLNYELYNKTEIYISKLEHYSNHLPWIELSNKNIISLNIIDLDNNNEINYNLLENEIKKSDNTTLKIISMTSASNVTGVITDIDKLKEIKLKYNNVLIFLDTACSSPYYKIDGTNIDAIFISGHKFLGGQQTPGILIAHQNLFKKNIPFCLGGGCIKKLINEKPEYSNDIETRESAGTPNIIGIIRLYYIYNLYDNLYPLIKINNKCLNLLLKNEFTKLMKKYTDLYVLNINTINKLPIISFNIKNIHYNYIVVLLNDLFGIQTRGGISCCGLLADYIEKKYGFRGWVRVSFSWKFNYNEIYYIINAIEYIIKYHHLYKSKYYYDKNKNNFIFIN
jgi:selenocysteine lyase/cysteine desulfurase